MRFRLVAIAALTLLASACSSLDLSFNQKPPENAIGVSGPAIVRNVPAAGTDVQAAAYIRLSNSKPGPEQLVRIACTCARTVEIHNTPANADMHAIPTIEIPANGALEIAPGGPHHLMLMGVTRPIAIGDEVVMTLHFDTAPPLEVTFTAVDNSRQAWAEISGNN